MPHLMKYSPLISINLSVNNSEISYTLHDVKTGNVRLLLREDEGYKIITGREKDEILSKTKTEEKKSIIIVETFRVNPKCQLMTVDGSSILMCNHIK
jgi:hypothetical protein